MIKGKIFARALASSKTQMMAQKHHEENTSFSKDDTSSQSYEATLSRNKPKANHYTADAIHKALNAAIEHAGLQSYDENCVNLIKEGLRAKITTIIESLIPTSRKRQAWSSIHTYSGPSGNVISDN